VIDWLYEKNGDLVAVEITDPLYEGVDLPAKVVYFTREIRQCLRKLGYDRDENGVDRLSAQLRLSGLVVKLEKVVGGDLLDVHPATLSPDDLPVEGA
jgi:hypothetical protein